MTYLITFSCYGARVHGDDSGSVDRLHNQPRSRAVGGDCGRAALERRLMDQPAYILDKPCRDAVLGSLLERAKQRGWYVLAAHVRANHVHIVIDSDVTRERVMNDLKAYASRSLNDAGLDTPDRKRWARHGSTRWLRGRRSVDAAIGTLSKSRVIRWRYMSPKVEIDRVDRGIVVDSRLARKAVLTAPCGRGSVRT